MCDTTCVTWCFGIQMTVGILEGNKLINAWGSTVQHLGLPLISHRVQGEMDRGPPSRASQTLHCTHHTHSGARVPSSAWLSHGCAESSSASFESNAGLRMACAHCLTAIPLCCQLEPAPRAAACAPFQSTGPGTVTMKPEQPRAPVAAALDGEWWMCGEWLELGWF